MVFHKLTSDFIFHKDTAHTLLHTPVNLVHYNYGIVNSRLLQILKSFKHNLQNLRHTMSEVIQIRVCSAIYESSGTPDQSELSCSVNITDRELLKAIYQSA